MKILVKVRPNAKGERIEKIDAVNFLAWVKEKPKEGKANQAVMKILAEYFGIAKSEITLIKGATSKQKVFVIGK